METKRPQDFKVLVNYLRNGVSVSRALYSGPYRKHAEKAYHEASVLGLHGILTDCTLRFFDGFKLRLDWDKTFPVQDIEKPLIPTLYGAA